MYDHLPGGEILAEGLRDIERGICSVSALLIFIAWPRLSRRGLRLPTGVTPPILPEHELYELLRTQHGPEAYRHYRSLLRRLVSLENALDAGGSSAST